MPLCERAYVRNGSANGSGLRGCERGTAAIARYGFLIVPYLVIIR